MNFSFVLFIGIATLVVLTSCRVVVPPPDWINDGINQVGGFKKVDEEKVVAVSTEDSPSSTDDGPSTTEEDQNSTTTTEDEQTASTTEGDGGGESTTPDSASGIQSSFGLIVTAIGLMYLKL